MWITEVAGDPVIFCRAASASRYISTSSIISISLSLFFFSSALFACMSKSLPFLTMDSH
ncbi:hypothetical protein BDZ85DRAFT_270256 [Elsinoe ampelina]|uniref:Uncharacterized protein n=1 Tax=Elsinoe ampelina TaxID=302913 RepID=A0A6A6FYC1_9PEZI|nr:hypothetical protein BDZ85DRAFT_270256 [Elsinoe ampelina]